MDHLKVLDEFEGQLHAHYEHMPAISNNGVTRAEMEWKCMAIAMAKEIAKLMSEKSEQGK